MIYVVPVENAIPVRDSKQVRYSSSHVSLAISPDTTESDIWDCIVPVFAPRCDRLDLRSASERDIAVMLKDMLKSLKDNSPDQYMNPDGTTHTVTLFVQTDVGTNSTLLRHQPALPERQNSVKRGRDQASARGKASTIGQNTLLQTAASRRMRNISQLLLTRSVN